MVKSLHAETEHINYLTARISFFVFLFDILLPFFLYLII